MGAAPIISSGGAANKPSEGMQLNPGVNKAVAAPLAIGQLTFDDAITARDEAMDRVERNAGEEFSAKATAFVLSYLLNHGESPGEDITDACKSAGIVPHDDRAFGPVYMRLVRSGGIAKCGTCKRRKGHGTAGGNLYRMA